MSLSLPVLDKILINHLLEVEKKYFTTITTELDKIHGRLDIIENKQNKINYQLQKYNININTPPPGLERVVNKIPRKPIKQESWRTVSYRKK